MNNEIIVKVGQNLQVICTPPKGRRHCMFRSRHVPYPIAIKEHATYARAEARNAALERSVVRFPDVDPSLDPMKYGIHPGLYILVVQCGDIIFIHLMTDLLTLINEIRILYEANKLARKKIGAWCALQCMPELTVSLFG